MAAGVKISALPTLPGSADGTEVAIVVKDGVTYKAAESVLQASKAPIDSPTFTGTVGGIDKTMVGLGNVDNTSDANKPVSTDQATAIGVGAAAAVATHETNNKHDVSYLNKAAFPVTGVNGIVYLDRTTGVQWFWNGTAYQALGWNPTGTALVDPVTGAGIAIADFAPRAFATLPNPTTVQAGVPYYVSDLGVGGSQWYSNGTKWVPFGGSVVIASDNGTLAAPIDTKTGATSHSFAPVTTFPTGLLVPGVSKVRAEIVVVREGANGTALMRMYFGKTAADWVFELALAATDGQTARYIVDFYPDNGGLFTTNWAGIGVLSTNSTLGKTNADFDTTAAQVLNFQITSADTLDTFKLISYQVTVFP